MRFPYIDVDACENTSRDRVYALSALPYPRLLLVPHASPELVRVCEQEVITQPTGQDVIVEPFAGPGGWDEGLVQLGRDDVIGIEWDETACRTSMAAGHLRVCADVASYPAERFAGAEGVIASPPCQAFSTAGNGHGRDHMGSLVAAVHDGDWTVRPDPDPRVWLVLEVGRWVEAIRPTWVALEQVPDVLPLWNAYAYWLRSKGYKTAHAILNAADYGVPQTRRRAFLVAHQHHQPHLPAPTHRRGGGSSLFGELEPWVSMADALGWGMSARPCVTLTAGGTRTGGPEPIRSRDTLLRERGGGRWIAKDQGRRHE